MFDPDDKDAKRRGGSLLALGSEDAGSTSLLSLAADEMREDALARHQRARLRREQEAASRATEPPRSVPESAEGPVQSIGEEPPVTPPRSRRSRWWSRARSEDAAGQAGSAPVSVREPAARELPPSARPVVVPVQTAPANQAEPDLYWKPLIDPMAVIGGVLRSKLLIAFTTILGALIGVAIALSTPKMYEASTELLVDPRDLKLTTNDLTQSGLPSDATLAIVENQVRVLTSGTVLNKVVDKLHLEADPEFNGEGGAASVGIREIISMIRAALSPGNDGAPGMDSAARRRSLAVTNLGRSLNVMRGGRTFVIVVSVTTQSGEKSALIANTMSEVFLQTYGEIQSAAAGRAESELNSRLDELRSGVEESERKVQQFKAENDIVDAGGRLITDDEIVALNGQLSTARARTLELNARAQSARGVDVDTVVGGALPEQIASGALTELRSQYATLKQEADRQAVRLGPRHPQRQAAEAQLAGAREQIRLELRRIVSSIQVELKRAVQVEQELASRLAQTKVRNGDLSAEMVTLRELEREVAAKRAVYEAFLLRAKETGEQKDVNTANMSVISTAYPPLDPNGPSRATVSLTGLVLGFLAGVALGALRGAIEGLRANFGVTPRRRRWLRAGPPPAGPEGPPPPAAARRPPVDHASDRRPPVAPGIVAPGIGAAPAAGPSASASTETASGARPETDDASPTMDAPMHDPYANHAAAGMPGYAQQPAVYPAAYVPAHPYPQPVAPPQPAHPVAYAPQAWQPQPFPVAPAPYGYQPQPPHHQAQQPVYQLWPQPAPAPYGYSQPAPMPPMPPQQGYAHPMTPVDGARRADNQSQIDEIRESLREFREAVRELTESRSRRRYP